MAERLDVSVNAGAAAVTAVAAVTGSMVSQGLVESCDPPREARKRTARSGCGLRDGEQLSRYADVICAWDRGDAPEAIAVRTEVPLAVVMRFVANWLDLCAGGEG